MPFKNRRISTICKEQDVNDISVHLFYAHDLDSANRKSWLKLTKHQTMNTVYKHLSSQTREQPKHLLTIRCRISMKNMKKTENTIKTKKIK